MTLRTLNVLWPTTTLLCGMAQLVFLAPLALPVNVRADEPTGRRHLLLCCGLPGDADHRERMTTAVRDIQGAADQVLDIDIDDQHVLVGDERMLQELAELGPVREICTSATVQAQVTRLSRQLTAEDSLVVILIGHAHLNGSASQLNVRDEDFDQQDFAAWCSDLPCKEQVFVLTQPLSGFWIRPLRSANRMVISATEADLEFTGTEMPYALAAVLSGQAQHTTLDDIDGDQQLSLFDLYVCVNLEIEGTFTGLARLQTEHAQLEDNGDGRGSEVQQPWLPIRPSADEQEQEGDDESEEQLDSDSQADSEADRKATSERPIPAITNENLDGYRARFFLLRNAPAAQPSPASEATADDSEDA